MIHIVASMSYAGVGLLMAIENVVLFLPSELIMPLAGFLAGQGRMTLWGAILAGSLGAVIGTLPIYIVARALGEERVTGWILRHRRWFFLRKRDLDKANDQFHRHGGRAVFLSKLLPGVRALIVLPAGFAHMNVALFLVASFAGTLVWCAALAILGNVLGVSYQKVHQFLGPVTWVIVGGIGLGVALWVYRRHKRRHQVRDARA